MNFHLTLTILLCMFLAFKGEVSAQDSTKTQMGRPLTRLLEGNEPKIDSSRLLFYTLEDITRRDTFQLKGLSRYFQQYDPARQGDFDHGHLGNMGSSAYPLALTLKSGYGFSLGYRQYDLYHKTTDDTRIFDQVRPFSELYFSGGETQSDLRVKALFSRSFANNVNWVIDYDRISQAGIYDNQGVKQTSFLSTLSYNNEKRLSLFFTYIINASAEEINGGVKDIEVLGLDIYRIRSAVPVFSEDAASRLQNQQIAFNVFYRLGADSIKTGFINSIQYQIQTFNEFYRFTDASTSKDAELYQNYWVSDRGIRNYNELNRIRNGFFLNSKYKDIYYFKTGAVYDYNAFQISDGQNTLNEIYLKFKGGIKIKERLSLDGNFYYGLLDVANEFRLDAKANLKLSKNQGFNFGFVTSRYGVNWIQEQAAINQSIFYDIEVKPIILQTLSAEYYNKRYHYKVGGQIQNTFNYAYYDTLSLPQQEAGLYAVSLLYGGFDIKYKTLLIENFLFLQNQNKQLTNLPTAFTKNSISYMGFLFKENMLVKVGLDFRYIVNDFLPQYNPVIGQFYLNTSTKTERFPLVDARISFKVSSFTTFLKYENLTSLLNNNIHRMVLRHPQFDASFRFGILWNLWN